MNVIHCYCLSHSLMKYSGWLLCESSTVNHILIVLLLLLMPSSLSPVALKAPPAHASVLTLPSASI